MKNDILTLLDNIKGYEFSDININNLLPVKINFLQYEQDKAIFSLHVPFALNVVTNINTYDFITLIPNKPIKVYSNEVSSKYKNMHSHTHSYYEMVYIYKGSITHNIESKSEESGTGEIFILDKNVRHLEYIAPDSIIFFFCLSEKYMEYVLNEQNQSPIMAQFLKENFNQKKIFNKGYLKFVPKKGSNKKVKELNSILFKIAQESILMEIGYGNIVSGLFERFFSYLIDEESYLSEYNHFLTNYDSVLFERMSSFIQDRNGKVSRKDLTDRFNYNSDYLNRVIKKCSGQSLIEFNNGIRIDKAEELLISTNLSIDEIVEIIGIKNKTHFYDLFERKHSIKPSEFRNINKKNIGVI